MVLRNWLDGCVCDTQQCPTKTQGQFNLCKRMCTTGLGGCAQCFPNHATVHVLDKETRNIYIKSMEELRVGDEVLTENGFSAIFAFMDHTNVQEGDYVSLLTSEGHEMTISPDHILYAHQPRRAVLAGTVQKGDWLWIATNETRVEPAFHAVSVERVRRGREQGLHAPLTRDGTVVVDGFLASSYAKARSLMWGEATLVSGHQIATFLNAPLRFACDVSSSFCEPAWYDVNGRHLWVQWVLDTFATLGEMNAAYPDIRAAIIGPGASFASVQAAVLQVTVTLFLALSYYAVFALHPVAWVASASALVCARVFWTRRRTGVKA